MNDMQSATSQEKRRHPRIRTENLVEYTLLDPGKDQIDQGKGIALNISQSGLLLGTRKPLRNAFILLKDLGDIRIKFRGKIVWNGKNEVKNIYLSGIEFIGSKEEQQKALIAFVKSYQRRKHKLAPNSVGKI